MFMRASCIGTIALLNLLADGSRGLNQSRAVHVVEELGAAHCIICWWCVVRSQSLLYASPLYCTA